MVKDRNYAADLLDKLITLDKEVASAYYEMGQILQAFRRDRLFEQLSYDSFKAMVEEELTFTANTAGKYADTFHHFRRLHYNKREALDLIEEFSYTKMSRVLPGMNDKIGKRAIKKRIENESMIQVNFMLDRNEFQEFEETYALLGGIVEGSRRVNSSDVFMDMVREMKALHSKGKAA